MAFEWLVGSAGLFFGMTTDGSLELAQMAIARLYDKASGSVTVPRMLDRTRLEVSTFARGTKKR